MSERSRAMEKTGIRLTTPLTLEQIASLHAGDKALINGIIYVARDAAHKRMVEALDRGEPLPFHPEGQIIYYMGPTPAKPGRPIGSAGPTTRYRMDVYAPRLMAAGIKGMIGKGERSPEVLEAIQRYKCVYFAATGGAGALISRSIVAARVIAYEDLGPEAVQELTVVDFPAIVINDIYGGDAYTAGREQYRKLLQKV
ncbi:MAG: Fe-S-containing hydro-lyase [Anaerolineae bacterium]